MVLLLHRPDCWDGRHMAPSLLLLQENLYVLSLKLQNERFIYNNIFKIFQQLCKLKETKLYKNVSDQIVLLTFSLIHFCMKFHLMLSHLFELQGAPRFTAYIFRLLSLPFEVFHNQYIVTFFISLDHFCMKFTLSDSRIATLLFRGWVAVA